VPIWIENDACVVATAWGIARVGSDEPPFVYSRKGLRRDQAPPEMMVFAVLDPEGQRALIKRDGEGCAVWSHGAPALSPLGAPAVFAAVSRSPGELVVAVPDAGDGRQRLGLHRARLSGSTLELGTVIELPPAPRLEWESPLWSWSHKWPEDDPDADPDEPFDARALGVKHRTRESWLGRLRLVQNRCGIAVAATYSGIVAVLDRRTLEPRLCVRVPTDQEQFDIMALPTPTGVLITLVADYRHTEYVFVEDGGTLVATRSRLDGDLGWGASSAGILWNELSVLVNQSDAMYRLSLPSLKATRWRPAGERYAVDAGASTDGTLHAIAFTTGNYKNPKSWQLERYDATKSKSQATELAMPMFREIETRARSSPSRADGAPALGLTSDKAPWNTSVGATLRLELALSNRGGAAGGLYVELGGDAARSLVSGVRVSAGASKDVAFEKRGATWRAELPDAELEAGFADAADAKLVGGQPTVSLVVEALGERAGSALMTVRVGPMGATGTTGSALQGRSVTVAATG
jgi:hypothetical protein